MGKQIKGHREGGRVRIVLCERMLVLHYVQSAHKLHCTHTVDRRFTLCGMNPAEKQHHKERESQSGNVRKKLTVVCLPNRLLLLSCLEVKIEG